MQCNRQDGSCACIKGIAGHNCDKCSRGHTGTAPYCQSCGECFENWDQIISQLKEETQKMIETASKIKQTGTPGAYKDEFADIENKIVDIDTIIMGANVSKDDVQNVEKMINELKRNLQKLQNKLNGYDKKIDANLAKNTQANLILFNLKQRATTMKEDINHLRDQATQLQASNAEGAFNLTQDAYRRSQEAEKKVANAIQTMFESERIRRQNARLMDQHVNDQSQELEQNRLDLQKLQNQTEELEKQIPKINELVCGGNVSLDECHDICGGIGCSHCGSFPCHSAMSEALAALELSEKTEGTLKELKKRGEEEMRKVEDSKRKSEEALRQATLAFERANVVKNNSEETNKKLQDLFNQIDQFLNAESVTPDQINTMIKDCLDTKISITPEDILNLAQQINNSMSKITDVDKIIVNTSGNLATANSLKQQADNAKSRANHVLETARKVINALKDSKEAQEQAEAKIEQANSNVKTIENDLGEIEEDTNQITNQSISVQNGLDQLQERLNNLRKKFTQNVYEVDKASKSAEDAGSNSKDAELFANELSSKYEQAKNKLKQKGSASGDIKKRSQELKEKAEKMAKDATEKILTLQKIEDDFDEYAIKVKQYSDAIDRLNSEIIEYSHLISKKAQHHKSCVI